MSRFSNALTALGLIAGLGTAHAQSAAAGPLAGWGIGAVLDVAATSKPLAMGQRDRGLALGHSDVVARGPLGSAFSAQIGAALHQHEGKLEVELEEAWVQTRTLPAGWQLRAGRFASQIGYLNAQHPHADDFVERPLLYRAFLGGHWFDDGLRVNWTAPTDGLYLRLGAEVFSGKQLVKETVRARQPGAYTLSAKMGGDFSAAHSWQAGASYVGLRRVAAHEEEEEGAAGGADEHHHHAHGAGFSGRHLWLGDLTWKWAPGGNNREQQLRVSTEWALVTGLGEHAASSDRHRAAGISAVWRFAPAWEVGARTDWLAARAAHGDHFHDARLREHSAMLAWKPTHAQVLRLQWTSQTGASGIEGTPSRRTLQLQYVMSFGAHGAHSF